MSFQTSEGSIVPASSWMKNMTAASGDLEMDCVQDSIASHMAAINNESCDVGNWWMKSMSVSSSDLLADDEDLSPVEEVHMFVPGSKTANKDIEGMFEVFLR